MTTTYTPPPPPPPVAPQSPVQPVQPAKSSGCLKWALVGCGVLVVLFVAFIAVLVLGVFAVIKRSDVYKESLAKVQSDQRVVAALGTPIEAGWVVTGKVNLDNGKGVADINYSVKGPNDKADVHAVASKEPGQGNWDYSEITVTPSRGSPINVLQP